MGSIGAGDERRRLALLCPHVCPLACPCVRPPVPGQPLGLPRALGGQEGVRGSRRQLWVAEVLLLPALLPRSGPGGRAQVPGPWHHLRLQPCGDRRLREGRTDRWMDRWSDRLRTALRTHRWATLRPRSPHRSRRRLRPAPGPTCQSALSGPAGRSAPPARRRCSGALRAARHAWGPDQRPRGWAGGSRVGARGGELGGGGWC